MSTTRLSHDEYFLQMLQLIASRGTCCRRKVGALLVDEDHHVLATGYNGPPRGLPNCIDEPCPGAHDIAGNTERCLAVHAEINALLQASRLNRAHTLYCSACPCFHCAKALLNTPVKRVVYLEEYADARGLDLLQRVLKPEQVIWAPRLGY